MHSRTVLLIAAMVCLALAQAQTTFNIAHHNVNMFGASGKSVFEVDDGYVLFSTEWGTDTFTTSIFISKFDLEGVFLWQKEHNIGRNVSVGIMDPVAQVDSGFVAAVAGFGGPEPTVTHTYWFDHEGDTIRTRFFKADNDSIVGNHGTRQLLALSDGGYLHCGWCAVPLNTACITRLDSAGNILWEQLYGGVEQILNAIETPDGGFVLGGSRNTNIDKSVLIRTDNAGAIEWVQYHGLYSFAGAMRALLDPDGNILTPGGWKEDPSSQVYHRWSSLYKYSPTGVPLDRKDYNFSNGGLEVHIVDKSPYGYWLLGGRYNADPPHQAVMTLQQLDQDLEVLWSSNYWHYASNYAESAIYSVRTSSDGGLIMAGFTRQGTGDPQPHLMSNWLLKLDEYGCVVPGCQMLGVQDQVLGLNEHLRVWPNPLPRGQALSLSFEPQPEFTAAGPLRVVVQDALGRIVHEQRITVNASPATIQVALPAGLYHLHLTDDARWLAGKKVVVE